MFMEVQPTGIFMSRVSLFFDEQHPDREDEHVEKYLELARLEPKRTLTVSRDGREYRVLQFGQCYLGQHFLALRELCGKAPVVLESDW